MGALKRVIKFQNFNLVKSVGIFWLVLLLVNVASGSLVAIQGTHTIIGPMIANNGFTSFAGSNLAIAFIFFIIYGALMYHEDLAMVLSSGVTRKDFYKGAIFSNITVALLFSGIQTTLLFIEKTTAGFLGYLLLTEFGIFNTSTDGFFFVMTVLFILFLTFASITNLMGILQFRWGYRFWIGFGIIMLALLNLISVTIIRQGGSSGIPAWLSYLDNLGLMFLLGLMATAIFFALGYIFVRKVGLNK